MGLKPVEEPTKWVKLGYSSEIERKPSGSGMVHEMAERQGKNNNESRVALCRDIEASGVPCRPSTWQATKKVEGSGRDDSQIRRTTFLGLIVVCTLDTKSDTVLALSDLFGTIWTGGHRNETVGILCSSDVRYPR